MIGENEVQQAAEKMVMSVNGPLELDQLGVVDAHSHVWIEQVPGANLDGLILDDLPGITADLIAYKMAGGSGIVDCQPGGCGRNGNLLRQISLNSGVHIIACSGFHLRRYYPADARIWQFSAAEAYAFFMDEVQLGLAETQQEGEPVFPGFFKIAAEDSLDASPMQLFTAVAAASRISGLAIEMHTEKGAAVEDFLAFFLKEGVAAERLIFCHVDKRPDFGLHKELAQAGVMLEYDTFVRPKYNPQQHAWPLLEKMIAANLGAQVALATDMALTSMWAYSGGGPGPAAFVTQVKSNLENLELEPELVQQLVGGNIAARLSAAGSQ